MTLSISQSATAIAVNTPASFTGIGGTEPYLYEVLPDGAGGTINTSTGVYVAPDSIDTENPSLLFDTIQVTDYAGAIETATILIGTPLILFCDIIQKEMGLADGRVYLWDQKKMQPKDYGLYIAVSNPSCKAFSNVNKPITNGSGVQQGQFTNMLAVLDIDIISRGPSARDRKEEVVLALNSQYSQQQQTANGLKIGTIPGKFINLSDVDGAAIPYRYRISVNMQYAVSKIKSSQYFDTFEREETIDNP